jgi:hypothetical protein
LGSYDFALGMGWYDFTGHFLPRQKDLRQNYALKAKLFFSVKINNIL